MFPVKLYQCSLQCYKHFSFSPRNLTPNTRPVVRKEKTKKEYPTFQKYNNYQGQPSNYSALSGYGKIMLHFPRPFIIILCFYWLPCSKLFLITNVGIINLLVLKSDFCFFLTGKKIYLLFSSHMWAALEGLSYQKCLRSDLKVYVSTPTIFWADV